MLKANLREYDLEVEITSLTPEEGGREGKYPWLTHYDHFGVGGAHWFARYDLQDREDLKPGETARAFVTFPNYPRYLVTQLQPGKSFYLFAGPRIVGRGIILSLLHLEKHRAHARQQGWEPRHDLKVELTLLTAEEGGLETSLPSLFTRPYLCLDGKQWAATFLLEDRDGFNPGETAPVFVKLAYYRPQEVIAMLHPDQPVLLHEDGRTIGRGRILVLRNFAPRKEPRS
jgi:hypothetical protein